MREVVSTPPLHRIMPPDLISRSMPAKNLHSLQSPSYAYVHRALANHPLLNRKRQPRPAFHLRQQSRPNRQHCLQMRLHTTIRRSRKNLQIHQRHSPGPICHPRLPLQPIRLPRTRLRRHDPGILPAELRSQFPDHGKDGCEWR